MHHYIHHGAEAPDLAAPELAHHAVVDLAPLGTTGGASAGLSPPQIGDCPELAGGGAIRGQGKADAADYADITAECKPLATLRARLALAGWVLATTPDNPHGAFTVSRWGMVRDLTALADVAVFTNRVTP